MIVFEPVPIAVMGLPKESGIGSPARLVQRRLRIEKIDVAWPAFHEQPDDRFSFWRMMRGLGRQWIACYRRLRQI